MSINENNSSEDTFYTDRVFESREDLMEWTQNLANSIGYVLVTRRSKAYQNGFVYKVRFICDCGREYRRKDISKRSGSKKTNCEFELVGKYSKEYGRWILKVICDQHNHPPTQYLEGHPYARRLTDDETHLVADLTSNNVPPRNILSTLKEQSKKNVSILKTIYSAQ